MVSSMHRRLLQAETDFLFALTKGGDAVQAFQQDWAQLQASISVAHSNGRLPNDTASLACSTATKIMIFAESLLDTHKVAKNIESKLRLELSRGLADHPTSSSPNIDSRSTGHLPSPIQRLDATAYSWLLQHLYDPYPSAVQTKVMAEACDVSDDLVERWFRDIRRSIGWTTLCDQYFAGSRAATTEAARAIFQPASNLQTVDPDVAFAFSVLKANSETLFSGLEMQKHVAHSDASGGADPHIVDVDEDDTTPPPPIAGHKRRANDEQVDVQVSSVMARPLKRVRLQSSDAALLFAGRPSSSDDAIRVDSSTVSKPTFTPLNAPSTPSVLPSSTCARELVTSPSFRKRRLSSCDPCDSPKRARRSKETSQVTMLQPPPACNINAQDPPALSSTDSNPSQIAPSVAVEIFTDWASILEPFSINSVDISPETPMDLLPVTTVNTVMPAHCDPPDDAFSVLRSLDDFASLCQFPSEDTEPRASGSPTPSVSSLASWDAQASTADCHANDWSFFDEFIDSLRSDYSNPTSPTQFVTELNPPLLGVSSDLDFPGSPAAYPTIAEEYQPSLWSSLYAV